MWNATLRSSPVPRTTLPSRSQTMRLDAVNSSKRSPRGLIMNNGASSALFRGIINELWLPICSFQSRRAEMRKTAAMSQRSRHSSVSSSVDERLRMIADIGRPPGKCCPSMIPVPVFAKGCGHQGGPAGVAQIVHCLALVGLAQR
jgi:hypothetical protein